SPTQHPPPPPPQGMVPGSARQSLRRSTRRNRRPQDHLRGTSRRTRTTPHPTNRRPHPLHLPQSTEVNSEVRMQNSKSCQRSPLQQPVRPSLTEPFTAAPFLNFDF